MLLVLLLLLGPAQQAQSLNEARRLFQQASALLEKGRATDAVPLLRKAARLAPADAAIRHYLGYALWEEGHADAAAAEFGRALELDSSNLYTRYFLARIAQSQQQLDRATALYEEILARGKPVYDTWRQLGEAYLGQRKLNKAADAMQEALRTVPLDGALHYQMANIYRRLGRAQAAQEEFEAARRLKQADQASIRTLFAISESIRSQRIDEARTLAGQLLAQSGSDAEVLIQLGIVLGTAGLYDDAAKALQLALAMRPDSFEAHCNLGLTLARQGQAKDAETELKEALKLRAESFEANGALASIYAMQGRTRDAIDRLSVALELRPNDPKVRSLLGQQHLQARQFKDAIQNLTAAVQLRPTDVRTRYLLAAAYGQNGQFTEALEVSRETLKLFPEEARAHLEVGRQLVHLKRRDEAQKFLEEARRLDPSIE